MIMFTNFLNCIFLISAPGGSEWILIILAVLILFGGRKIPEFMRGLGRGIREFNDAKNNVKEELEKGMNEKENKPVNSSAPVSNSTTTTQP
jgi:sec-independent protein translocase protein TatA